MQSRLSRCSDTDAVVSEALGDLHAKLREELPGKSYRKLRESLYSVFLRGVAIGKEEEQYAKRRLEGDEIEKLVSQRYRQRIAALLDEEAE